MNFLERLLFLVSLSFEIGLCVFVFVRKAHRILPLFATFACAVFASTIFALLLMLHFGPTSYVIYLVYWGGVFLFVTTRSLAIAELCRYGLRNYRGIWALVWRVLTALSVFLIAHAAINAWGQPNGTAIYWTSFARDFALASIIIFAVLFLFRHYYGLALDPLPRLIAIGMCFTCAVDTIGYTIVLNLFKGYLFPWFLPSQKALWPSMEPVVQRVNDIWSTVHLVSFMISMGIWCYALRKPVAEPTYRPELLPVEVYRELSPAINMRLATFNDRMAEILKP